MACCLALAPDLHPRPSPKLVNMQKGKTVQDSLRLNAGIWDVLEGCSQARTMTMQNKVVFLFFKKMSVTTKRNAPPLPSAAHTRAKRRPAESAQTSYHPRPGSGQLGGDSQVGDGVDSRAQLGPRTDSEFGRRWLGLRKKRPARAVLRRSISLGAPQRFTLQASVAKRDSTSFAQAAGLPNRANLF